MLGAKQASSLLLLPPSTATNKQTTATTNSSNGNTKPERPTTEANNTTTQPSSNDYKTQLAVPRGKPGNIRDMQNQHSERTAELQSLSPFRLRSLEESRGDQTREQQATTEARNISITNMQQQRDTRNQHLSVAFSSNNRDTHNQHRSPFRPQAATQTCNINICRHFDLRQQQRH